MANTQKKSAKNEGSNDKAGKRDQGGKPNSQDKDRTSESQSRKAEQD